MTKMSTLRREWMKDPEFRKGYEALGPEFELARTLIKARVKAKMSQADVAKKMGTSQSAVARIEGGGQKPSLRTLERYAAATNSRLKIQLVAD